LFTKMQAEPRPALSDALLCVTHALALRFRLKAAFTVGSRRTVATPPLPSLILLVAFIVRNTGFQTVGI